MLGYLVEGPHRHGLTELPEPVPGPGELLVAPAAVGICGSDLELLDGRRPADYVRYPIVPGHEWSGHVISCGIGVQGFEAGTPIVAEGVRACDSCARCAEGRNNLCLAPYAETGFTHPGALARRVVVPADQAHRLDSGRSLAVAALIEPAACVATGLLEVGVPRPGARLAVVGDGPLGLLAAALLRLTSPSELVLVGSRPSRIRYAASVGATATTHRNELAGLGGFDTVVECTNSPDGAVAALGLARRAGTVVLLGISGRAAAAVDPDVISVGHLRVQGVFAASRSAWQWLVQLYNTDLFDPSAMITHRFPLERVGDAFTVLADRGAEALKVIVEPNGDTQ